MKYQFDSLGQVTNGVKHFADGTLVPGQSFGYLFDDIGNRKQTQSGGDQSGAGLRPANYTVNSLNQITSREFPGTNDIIGAALIGNSVSVNGNTNVFRKGEYFWTTVQATNTDSAQWLDVTVASGGKTNTGSLYLPQTPENFVYDLDGNLISDGLWTNTWNAENRLIASESSAGVPPAARMKEEWSYLPDGRWSQRIVSKWISDAYVPQFTNKFVWDGKVLTAIVDQTNGLVMSFLRGADLSGTMQGAGGAGGLLAVSFKTNGTHFAAFDGNGNVAGLVSAANGSTSANYEYGPFGESIRITGSVGKLNLIRFSTQYADDVRNITKYLYREYFPSTGTWPSRDSLGEQGGVNVYGFVNNRPFDILDILGLANYRIGSPTEPPMSFDEDFIYDPNAKSTAGDHLSWAWWGLKLAGGELFADMPDACEAYAHYRGASGSDLQINYPKAYGEDKNVRDGVNNEIAAAQADAEHLSATGGNHFTMTGEAARLGDPTTENWQKTIGKHWIWGHGDVQGCDTFTMTITIHEKDRYNFNRGAKDIATGAPDDVNGQFAVLGWAKSFITKGEVVKKVTWKKGQIAATTKIEDSSSR